MRIYILLYLFLIHPLFGSAQLVIDAYPAIEEMIDQMFLGDSNIDVWNIQFSGAHGARGLFTTKTPPCHFKKALYYLLGWPRVRQAPIKRMDLALRTELRETKIYIFWRNLKLMMPHGFHLNFHLMKI